MQRRTTTRRERSPSHGTPSVAALVLATLLAGVSAAQDRTAPPVAPSFDVKTPAEPSFPTGGPAARPRLDPAPTPTTRKIPGDAQPPAGVGSVIDPGFVHYAPSRDGVLWARGANWKASFGEAGVAYYPALGRLEPHDLPHGLSPSAVSVGGAPLGFERAAHAAQSGDRVEIDRGSFVEAYDLAPRSVEQTFVFSSLPRTGDLVVDIPVKSELDPCSTSEGIEFRGERGRVTYGRATAIDAAGRRSEATTTLADGVISIRVDAGFVATAELPLVIDPVVSTFPIDARPTDNYWADAAYDPTAHIWLVVYEQWFSASDRDCAYGFLNDSGPIGSGFYLDLSSDAWDSVHVANNAKSQQFMVVSSVSGGGPVYVLASTIYANGSFGTQTVVTGTEAGTIRLCVVGGDPYIGSGSSYYCIAYERQYNATDWDILCRLVAPDGSLYGPAPTYLSNSGGTIDVMPAISKSNGLYEWMIAWQRNNGYVNDADIWGARVFWNGAVTAYPFQISAWFQPEWAVAVSSPLQSQSGNLVTWQETDSGDNEIIMALVDGTTVVDQEDLSIMEGYNYTLDQEDSTVDTDGDHFLVAYAEQFGGTDYDIYAADVYVMGGALALREHHVALDQASSADRSPKVVSAHMSGSQDPALRHRFLCSWNSTPLGGGPADVRGAFFDTLAGGTSTSFCFGDGSGVTCPCANNGAAGHGCANSANPAGALLAATGTPSTVADTFVLTTTGVPPTAMCVYLQGTTSSPVVAYGDGLRCAGGTLIRVGVKNAVNGASSYPGAGDPAISLRGGLPLFGGQRAYQTWYRNPTQNFCTPATFNVSSGVLVNWAP